MKNTEGDFTIPSKDFETLKVNSRKIEKSYTIDDYIDFVTQVNHLAGHKMKKFVPIDGSKFLL